MAAPSSDSTGANKRRFADITNLEITEIIKKKDADNTRKSTDQALRLLTKYLREKDMSVSLESVTPQELDPILAKFYAEARTEDGTLYKKSSLQTFRHGLCRYFSDYREINIMKDSDFKESNRVYSAVCKDLKRQSFGGIDHHPPVEKPDLVKMYQNFDLSNPKHLQWKVFIDIMLYFGRRGRENLREMKRSGFACTTDSDGLGYIYICKDELTKNHQDDPNTASGRMYEIKDDDEMCPVKTFVKLTRKLHPGCPYLFQRVAKKPKDNVWFDKAPLGPNQLGNMMSQISKEFSLSKSYTNHSLRATTVHVLDAAQFPGRHIMSVTGHKSETSLKTYTGYTTEKTKQMMSDTISEAVTAKSKSSAKDTATRSDGIDLSSNFDVLPLSDSQYDSLLTEMRDNDIDNVFLSQMPIPETCIPQPKTTVQNMNNTKTLNYAMNFAPAYCPPGPVLPVIHNSGGTFNCHINYHFHQK